MFSKLAEMQRPHKLITKDIQIAVPADLNCNQSKAGLKWKPSKKLFALVLILVVVSIGARSMGGLRSYVLSQTPSRSRMHPIQEAPHLLTLETSRADEAFWCDRSDNTADICFMRGDVHLVPGHSISLILYSVTDLFWHRDEIIWPYARKFDDSTLRNVEPVVMRNKLVESSLPSSMDAFLACDVVHHSPLLLFSIGGYTGNAYHDFNDVIIPLFISSRAYNGEVVFGITDLRDWWIHKFSAILGLLSKYEILNINSAEQRHCFPEATVGLQIHGNLAVNPSQMAANETIGDFQELLHEAFMWRMKLKDKYGSGPSPNAVTCSGCVTPSADNSQSINSTGGQLEMVIFSRKGSRKILNIHEVVQAAESEGFHVTVLEPSAQTEMQTLYRFVHGADVMMGVHGAALTHMLFMRPKSVFIQIVPLGAEWPAHCYREPAKNELELQYIEYYIAPNESSLSRTYSMDDRAMTDPESVVENNWDLRRKMYLEGQNVRLSISRVQSTFREAKNLALDAFRGSKMSIQERAA